MQHRCYTSAGWRPEDGGELCALDESRTHGCERCWRSVPPREGTILLFRSEQVLHQVMPSFVPRLAVTAFFSTLRPTGEEADNCSSDVLPF